MSGRGGRTMARAWAIPVSLGHGALVVTPIDVADLEPHIQSLTTAPPNGNVPRSVGTIATVGGRELFFKRSDERLDREAAMLALARDVGEWHGVSAVPLVAFDEARNVLVTERIHGASLFNVLWNGTSVFRPWSWRWSGWRDSLASIAEWLRRLHDHARLHDADPNDRPAAIRWLTRSIGAKLDHIGSRHLTAAESAHLRAVAAELAADPGFSDLPVSWIHGDATHSNVLVAGAHMYLLDFADARRGFACEDSLRLWTAIWEVSETSEPRRLALRGALDAILATAGLGAGDLARPSVLLLRLWNSLTKLSQAVSERWQPSRSTRRIERELIALHLRWLRTTWPT